MKRRLDTILTLLTMLALASLAIMFSPRVRKKDPAPPLNIMEKCTLLDVRLTSGEVEQLRQNGPLTVPIYLDEPRFKPGPDVICKDEALVRVSIDGHEVIKIERKDGPVTDPAAPVHPSKTLTAGW